jgi:uncharacterized protein YndB with AHSA1/START domain
MTVQYDDTRQSNDAEQPDDGTTVRCGIDVAAGAERAFSVFTDGINEWWHPDHHVQPGKLRRVAIEPQAGGRVLEESETGDVCTWGRVLTWDPPRTFAFSWQIGTDWGVPAPDAPASRVTVTFTPTDTGTRVELVHDRLDVHGTGWEKLRDTVASEGGWKGLLNRFASAA